MFQKSENGIEIVRLTNADFDILSQKIRNLFPNERQAFYYVPPKSEGPSQKISKGKLPDFYRNKLDECRQIGLIQKKRKKTGEDIDELDIDSSINPEAKRVCKTHLQWLRYNTAPWSCVKEHWNGSRELRQSFIKQHEGSVSDIFNEYPVLKQEFGYMLLDIDYDALIDEKSNIYNEWPDLSKKLETLLENRVIKDKTFAKQLEEIQLYKEGDEHRDAALLFLIPVLCPSNARLRISGGNKIWRPTIAESMDAFICHIKIPGELEKVKRRRQERAAKLKDTVQPYIIVIGPQLTAIEAFYIIIDDIMYKMENVLKAVDILYKIFQVLNVKYPPACEQVWLFIQKYIYGRTTKWDKYDKSVMNLIDHLNRI
ncbi:uncharacterized protein LOC112462188 [Temnothorax curvispinosus]|uniref:Uncharacterized protein LOC112462188 n=2 Tax=Temnothorax TaxID=300110 RepID=A0A6J1QNS1_9HYME|nr:uncharacterized protein LOC112462188 [Temnothorax curvispinosus]